MLLFSIDVHFFLIFYIIVVNNKCGKNCGKCKKFLVKQSFTLWISLRKGYRETCELDVDRCVKNANRLQSLLFFPRSSRVVTLFSIKLSTAT